MDKENNQRLSVYFIEEFNKSLDQIHAFVAEQGEDVLEWWFSKEDNMIDDIDRLSTFFPYLKKRLRKDLSKGFVALHAEKVDIEC